MKKRLTATMAALTAAALFAEPLKTPQEIALPTVEAANAMNEAAEEVKLDPPPAAETPAEESPEAPAEATPAEATPEEATPAKAPAEPEADADHAQSGVDELDLEDDSAIAARKTRVSGTPIKINQN